MSTDTPLVLVSNRGPVTFQPGGEIKRGTGGLVTALIGLASHRHSPASLRALPDYAYTGHAGVLAASHQ